MKNYYHCFDCIKTPLIHIKNDYVKIICPIDNKKIKKKEIITYCQECIENCVSCNQGPSFFDRTKNQFYCKNCCFNQKIAFNFIKNNYYCLSHSEYYTGYCASCDRNICEKCKIFHTSPKHKIKPDEECYKNSSNLDRFVDTIRVKIREIKDILKKFDKELDLYESISLSKKFIITKEMILNLENLKIINKIEEKKNIFINKINEIINELNNFYNFEYISKKENFNNNIDNNNMNNNNKNNNDMNKIEFNNNKENVHLSYKTYPFKIENINNSYNFTQTLKKGHNIIQIYQEPLKNLYQIYSFKLQNIENKNKYLVNKIIDISNNLEYDQKLKERFDFIYCVSNIARIANNYSKELADKLLDKFYEKNQFSSILYERAMIELSSWVNQSLVFVKSDNEDIKDIRNFFDINCKNEKQRINDYIQIEKDIKSFYKEPNFNFQILFRDLSQLYTEIILYSEKNIDLIYAENEENSSNYYKRECMKDINDLIYGRLVIFTVLPGLFVNKEIIQNGKILVFCDNNLKGNNLKFENLIEKEFKIKDTIKSNYIKDEVSCNLEVQIINDKYKIEIITTPEMKKNDHPKFSIKSKNNKIIDSKENNVFFILKKKYFNIQIFGTVEINNMEIKSKECLIHSQLKENK